MRLARLFLIPVLAGLVASVAAYAAFSPKQAVTASADLAPALVAKRDIQARTLLNGTMFEVRQVPREMAAGALANPQDTEGRISVADLVAGELLLKAKVATAEKGSLPYRIPAGHRAVTIQANEFNSVAGYPESGDSVDVVVTLQIPDYAVPGAPPGTVDPNKKIAQARLLFQNVLILAKNTPASAKNNGEPAKLTSYTLALTPAQAVELALVEEVGHIKLILRPALKEDDAASTITDEIRYRSGR